MRVVAALALIALAAAALWIWQTGRWADLTVWAVTQQREVQNDLARLVMAARRGEAGVVWGLIAASGLYGVVHAVGPGHGKFLIGGAGIASRAPARTMAALALASSLAQGATAVVLVYAGLGLLSLGAGWAVDATERILTPLGYAAIAAIGAVLTWRGVRVLLPRLAAAPAGHSHPHARSQGHDHSHAGPCGCGHRHAPTLEDVARLSGWRDAAALVAGIAIRPCTGAVMVLVIAWQTGLHALGLSAVLAMALGTGAVTAVVALASVALRETGFAASGADGSRLAVVAPALQLGAGAVVLALSLGMLAASLG